MASSSSKSKPKWIYDVFINFRGKDTRKNFVSHLYAALSNAGINTFLDDEKLEKGKKLGQELMRAIEGSQISIVVFSKNYTQSSWCLDELAKIMECRTTRGQVVLPVFYDVTPLSLRYWDETLGEAIVKSERTERNSTIISYERYEEIWMDNYTNSKGKQGKRALREASSLAGWDVRNFSNESTVVKQIVDEVLKILDRKYSSDKDFLVGVESRVEKVIRFLRRKTRGVHIVGIWGMEGIGKTSIAKVIFNRLLYEFEDQSFLANIREAWEKDRGPIDLQEQLLSDILKTTTMKVHNIKLGRAMIKERLCTKNALVVLDDVNKFEQLNALCGNRDEIASGSIIIITTRDVRLLDVLKVDYAYGVEKLNEWESLELFSWHAFRGASPRKDFLTLSRNVVAYCGGLPSALKVLGRYLYERRKEEWQSVLSKLKIIPNNLIQEKLKSYDGLRNQAYVIEILNDFGLHSDIEITILIGSSVIKVEMNNKLGVHDLLWDIGKEIVHESSLMKLEKRSRL